MKEDLSELVFIIDRSASMGELKDNTIEGFNSMLKDQKRLRCETLFTIVLFDRHCTLLHDRVDISTVPPLTQEDYKIGHGTALLDAIGLTMHRIRDAQQNEKEECRPKNTQFVIITDGGENCSCKYTKKMIRERIKRRKRKYHWEFALFSAGTDAVSEAAELGIASDCVQKYLADPIGMQLVYMLMSSMLMKFRRKPIQQRTKELTEWMLQDKDSKNLPDIFRTYWSKTALMTGDMDMSEDTGREVPQSELLPGELSALLFEVGCYIVRSAKRVYRVNQDGTETPASEEDLETYKSRLEQHIDGWVDDLRPVHEISARHHNAPAGEFIRICSARNAHGWYWSESVNAIYAAKKNSQTPDEFASLFVNKNWCGSSRETSDWYQLEPTGRIQILCFDNWVEDSDEKKRFIPLESPVDRFYIQPKGESES